MTGGVAGVLDTDELVSASVASDAVVASIDVIPAEVEVAGEDGRTRSHPYVML